ncbi:MULTISPECIES: hypothetical protein [Natrialbaceae]|uniref:hypothetical protein n=1 Tax=Natrialbaceae TaxID=1644061 RepID=UPI00207D0345|nr:hypothetical protein [Natronococcus sp. CG52]
MSRRKSAVGAALLGFALSVVHLSPGYVTQQLVAGEWGRFPQLDTPGETLVLYHYTVDATAFVLGFGAVFALGYWIGTDLDLRRRYRQFALAVGFGGLIGYLIPMCFALLYLLITADGATVEGIRPLDVILFAGRALGVPIQFAVAGFAGAAFAHLTGNRLDTDPSRKVADGE